MQRLIMNSAASQGFLNRIQTAIGWTVLLGMSAGLNFAPCQSEESSRCFDRALVLPLALSPPVVPSPIRKWVPEPQTSRAPSVITPMPKPFTQLPSRQRVVVWFTEYDKIRREAQMTPSEKADAVRLWASSYVQSNSRDSEDARTILTKLVLRYERAALQLAALPTIAETQSLHDGYLEYFCRAHAEFSHYVDTLERKSAQAALAQMHDGRQKLAAFDARNKSLDRQLRLKHNIADFKA